MIASRCRIQPIERTPLLQRGHDSRIVENKRRYYFNETASQQEGIRLFAASGSPTRNRLGPGVVAEAACEGGSSRYHARETVACGGRTVRSFASHRCEDCSHDSSGGRAPGRGRGRPTPRRPGRSEEHTSELQSLRHLVCRLLLEKT